MNIKETILSMEEKGVMLAIDIGEHGLCDLGSNCPIAVQVRKLITESGMTLDQIMQGYQAITADPLRIVNFITGGVSSKAVLNLAGKSIEVDLTDIISKEAKDAIKRKLDRLELDQTSLKGLGESLYQTYLSEIATRRRLKFLPQFQADIKDLVKYKVSVTGSSNQYHFIFATEYHPEYIIHDRIRYRLSQADMDMIRRKTNLVISASQEGNITQVLLMDENGEKLIHYHGRQSDCWGTVELRIKKGEFNLNSLYRISLVAMNSVQTINYDSLMNREAPGMPNVDTMLKRSVKLGKEGQVEPAKEERPAGWFETATTANIPPRPAWGRR